MSRKIFNAKVYWEGMRQLRVLAAIFLILSLLLNCADPLMCLVERASAVHDDAVRAVAPTSALTMGYYLLILAAIIMTFSLFRFLNKRNGSDFYHSLPITRPCLLLSLCASVFTLIAVIFAVSIFAGGLLYTAAGMQFLWGTAALSLLSYLVGALLLSACTLIGMSLTGAFVPGFVLGLLIFLLPRILIYAYAEVLSEITVIANIKMVSIFTNLSYNVPVNMCLGIFLYGGQPVSSLIFLPGILYTFILGALYLAVACVVFTFRKSETAEQSAPNKILQHVYRCLITVPVSLLPTVMIVESIASGDWIDNEGIILSVLVTVAVYFIYELITTRKLRNLLSALPVLLAVLLIDVIAGGSLLLSRSAILSQRPTASEIKSVSFLQEHRLNDYTYFDIMAPQVENDSPAVREAVAKALETDAEQVLNGTYYRSSEMHYSYTFSLSIRTTGGKTLLRNLRLDADNYSNELLPEIMGNSEYHKYATSLPPEDTVDSVLLDDRAVDPELYRTFREEFERLSDSEKYILTENANAYHYYETSESLGQLAISGKVNSQEYANVYDVTLQYFPETARAIMAKTFENRDAFLQLIDAIRNDVPDDFDISFEDMTKDEANSLPILKYTEYDAYSGEPYVTDSFTPYLPLLDAIDSESMLAPAGQHIYRLTIFNVGSRDEEKWTKLHALLEYIGEERPVIYFAANDELAGLLEQAFADYAAELEGDAVLSD